MFIRNIVVMEWDVAEREFHAHVTVRAQETYFPEVTFAKMYDLGVI